jgi:hypothetical protein
MCPKAKPESKKRKGFSRNTTKRKSFEPKMEWENDEGEPIRYADYIGLVIDLFMSKPLDERLQKLISYLEERGSKTDKKLASKLREMAGKIETMDDEWEANGVVEDMAESVDWYIEEVLPQYIYAMLHQLTIEGLVASHRTPEGYQDYMRFAVLPDEKKKQLDAIKSRAEKTKQLDEYKKEMPVIVDDFLTHLYSRLIEAPRRKRNQITPGGSDSPLKECATLLWLHYERLHPIWRDTKKVYTQHGGGKSGREAVSRKYCRLGVGESWTIKPEYIGLPDELLRTLEEGEVYISSPECLAYRHAAFLCGFKINEYSVKQIKRVVSEGRKFMSGKTYEEDD